MLGAEQEGGGVGAGQQREGWDRWEPGETTVG